MAADGVDEHLLDVGYELAVDGAVDASAAR